MKQSPKLTKIQENMQPGQITADGFMGDDDRSLSDILNEDNENVKSMDQTHESIAKRMEYFTNIAIKELGNEILIEDDFLVSVDDHRGFISCPFMDNHKANKRNTKLKNIKLDKTVYWSDLNIHMIAAHGFYEGKGSFFRIETDEIIKILGLDK